MDFITDAGKLSVVLGKHADSNMIRAKHKTVDILILCM
jgi:hypothetical protein